MQASAILDALANDEIAREVILDAADRYRRILRAQARRLADLNYTRKFSKEAKDLILRDYHRVSTDQMIVSLSKIHPGRITPNKVRLAAERLGLESVMLIRRVERHNLLFATA